MKISVRRIKGQFHATITFWDGVTLEFYNRAKFRAVYKILQNYEERGATA